MKETLITLGLLLAIGACSPDISQQVHPREPITPQRSSDLASQDRDFLERATQANNAEIAIGGLVDGRALRPEVLSFGQRMVSDHTEASRRLIAVAAKHRIYPTNSLGAGQASFDRVVSRRLDAFDHEFVKVMVDDHNAAAELFRSEASGGVDPALRAYAAQTLPMIEAHLEQAKAIYGQVMTPPQEPEVPPSTETVPPPPASSVPASTPLQNRKP